MNGSTVPVSPDELDAGWLRTVLAAGSPWSDRPFLSLDVERIGAQHGFDGVVARVTPHGAAGPLPTLVAKWSNPPQALREATVLADLRPDLGPAVPSTYGFVVDIEREIGVVLLEEIRGAEQGDCLQGAPRERLRRIASLLDRLHAIDPERGAALGLPTWKPVTPVEADEWRATLGAARAAFPTALEAAGPVDELPIRVRRAGELLERAPHTIVHRDVHLDNTLFRADGSPVLLDWPGASLGPAEIDLAHLLIERVVDGEPLTATDVGSEYSATGRLEAMLTLLLYGLIRWGARGPTPGSRMHAVCGHQIAETGSALRRIAL